MTSMDVQLRPQPYLDVKWLRADLNAALRNPEDLSVLWNNLVQDNELALTQQTGVVNNAGHLCYQREDGKYYCGVERLSCACCSGYCSPSSACNCVTCQRLDSEDTPKKNNTTVNNATATTTTGVSASETIFESWLWGPIPSQDQKSSCIKALLTEQRELSLQAAGNCLSAMHLKQLLLIYQRYFTALSRCKAYETENKKKLPDISLDSLMQKYRQESPIKNSEKATLGLARVGTRAALNFSFAFLRRAWRSGEDTELCSELLIESLEALQGLPEASLFDTSQVSQLWLEVLERSIKFLRQVVLGDVMGGRCAVPRADRHIALNLLLELGAQKGSLGAALEAVLLLLTLWEKDKETDDNRVLPQNTGAPLVPILRRFERILNPGSSNSLENGLASPTESFLRFLTLPDQETSNIDLKQAAVVIVSHLDRLAKPHLPAGNFTSKNNSSQTQQIFALGWFTLAAETYGFTAEPAVSRLSAMPGQGRQYSAATLDIGNNEMCVDDVISSEKCVHILTKNGEVYVINFSNMQNGSGISSEGLVPSLVEGFDGVQVLKMASHFEAKHFLALTLDHQVYSWGLGDSGRLGHGDTQTKDLPTKIQALSDKVVTGIFCGATYSAAVTAAGELYTWGLGRYGRLGHGNSDDKHSPVLVTAMKPHHVMDVALGTGDAHTLCVTTDGIVFAWGDGDFGKLGTNLIASQLPVQIESIARVSRVYSGANFSAALTMDGSVYTWGYGPGGRLGHDSPENKQIPTVVQALQGKKIVHLAVGSAHCLALSVSGELYGWGRNDYQQICPSSVSRDPIIKTPILATPLSLRVSGISCGLAQSIIWCHASALRVPTRTPFIIDLTEHTFRMFEQLLAVVCSTETRQPPSQEAECIAVACLNLLRLQLHALISNNISPRTVGLGEGSRLLASLKSRILVLAGGPTILRTMQEAAQWTLQVGWSVLLPTAAERAQTLTSFLPTGLEPSTSTSGHRFMTDLLVGSLMAEGGLQTALSQAINSEPEDCSNGHNLPLLHLIKQLLRNNAGLTQVRLGQLITPSFLKTATADASEQNNLSPEPSVSPSLDLLHRFQRLLLSHIYQSNGDELAGAEALLSKYLQHVVTLCIGTLNKAHEVALQGKDGVADVLRADISDTLLYELLIGLILLHRNKSNLLTSFEWMKTLVPLLHSLDNVNRLICESEIQDADDMGWPAIICRGPHKPPPPPEETFLVRKSDLENHTVDGGKWIIINGVVYDIQNYQCDNSVLSDIFQASAGKDLSAELSAPQYRTHLEYITSHLRVGKYGLNDCDEKKLIYHPSVVLTHFNTERTLAYLLGLRAGLLQKGPALQTAELQCRNLLRSAIFSGGLQMLQPSNPFDEEKGEARSSASTAGSTPTTEAGGNQQHVTSSATAGARDLPLLATTSATWPHLLVAQRVESLLMALSEAKLTDPLVISWITIAERFCKENNLIWHQDFPPEHPVQELERLLTAVLIRHQSLGPLVLAVIDRELSGMSNKPPKPVADIIRLVQQTKWTLIRTRQQLNRSYKEVCAPILDRCRFLLYEIRPAISLEQNGLRRLCILYKFPRFKALVCRIIAEMRIARKQLACAKPEDILNVTIQSQQQQQAGKQQILNASTPVFGRDVVTETVNLATKNLSNENLYKLNSSNENLDTVTPTLGLAGAENKSFSNENLMENGSGDSNVFAEKKTETSPIPLDDIKTPTNEPTEFVKKQKSFDSTVTEQFINDVISKLSEKCLLAEMAGADVRHSSMGSSQGSQIMQQIVEFIMQESGSDVETLRRAMFCQVQRYHIRRQGLDMFADLLSISGLLDAVQYNLLSGYLGLFLDRKQHLNLTCNVLDDLNMVTAFQKADIILAQSKIIEWGISELQRFVNQDQVFGRQKYHNSGKDNSNLGTYVFLKKLPRARFLLSVFGVLARDLGPNELSLVINSGTLGSILGLLRQTGNDVASTKVGSVLTVVYEDTILKQKSSKANLTGPELAKLMKIGTRIVRGVNWKWADQDGPSPGEGRIISEVGEDGWVRVEWDTGATNSYRMGKEGQYDLGLAESASNMVSPDADSDKDDILNDLQLCGDSHPTKLLKQVCIKMLQIISVGVGQHGDQMQKSAVMGVASMFRAILGSRMSFLNLGLEHWTTLGFLRALSSSKVLSKHLTAPIWIEQHLEILHNGITCEQDVYKKVQCLRLLQATLVNWDSEDVHRTGDLVRKLFIILGTVCLYCPYDLSLLQCPGDVKSRVPLTTSHSGTIAEEIIVLLRKLHTLPIWNGVINSFLSQKLCVAAELFSQDGDVEVEGISEQPESNENDTIDERIYVAGILNTIGGCDPRPRLGMNLTYDGQRGTIACFTNKGKVLMSVHVTNGPGEIKKIPISVVSESADIGAFSLSRLPINEMLLNSWSVLLYGMGDKRNMGLNGSGVGSITSFGGSIDVQLLRKQQTQLAALNGTCVLFRHQNILRKILRQRSPGIITRYSSDESLSEKEEGTDAVDDMQTGKCHADNDNNQQNQEAVPLPTTSQRDNELLVQSILQRATQPSPLKASYTFQELALAALNVSQMLSSHVHVEVTAPFSATSRASIPHAQPTLVHGVPIYNDIAMIDDSTSVATHRNRDTAGATVVVSTTSLPPPCPLVSQIIEMGFSRQSIELAISTLTSQAEVPPTAEQIVQWILEHIDQCPLPLVDSNENMAGGPSGMTGMHYGIASAAVGAPLADVIDSDSDSVSSDTVEGSSLQEVSQTKYATRDDFKTADQYAMYVRGLVCPGMTIRCCRDFEEIREGDIGTVLKVDTEGLHDLNVQVDWQMHGSTFWMCFIHIEMLEPPPSMAGTFSAPGPHVRVCENLPTAEPTPFMTVGSQVRIRNTVSTTSTAKSKETFIARGSIGTITNVSGRDITVDFHNDRSNWVGQVHEVELLCGNMSSQKGTLAQNLSGIGQSNAENTDLINDWSRCIRSLTVSSNEPQAKHLLDRSANYWQSSTNNVQNKHCIRIEMHDNILIHQLSLTVDPTDGSHMPSLIVVRVGDSLTTLKDFSWVSVNTVDVTVPLLADIKQYHQWVEIVIKQCRNNGIQCRVHGVQIVGRRKQTDLDLMLINASFLASEYDSASCVEPSCTTSVTPNAAGEPSASYSYSDEIAAPTDASQCKVLVWGLNDKEQLGGLKGSKIKIPTLSATLSQLRPIHLAGGSKSLFVVSQDGKVYACGEGTNGRLGLGNNCNVSTPRQVPILSQYVVKKVAVHSGGKHAMALTLDGKVFSWGEGEDGKLGHGNRMTLDKPKLIETLRSKRVRDIACGSSHSAAITSSGELYTWGLGEYGRLGHNDNCTQLKPKLVAALFGHRIIQVACGSRDAQTLALTEEGLVFSWGDGDFGKLGRGGSEGCSIPHQIERLNGAGIMQIECGAQFSLALTRSGEVWTWGKGDYYRLGHGSDQHVRKPTPIQGLRGKKVIHVAVGALHCLAVTDIGQVYAWGDNDHGQQGSGSTTVNKKPCQVVGLDGVFVNRVACGSSHSVAWSLPQSPAEEDKKEPVPFNVAKDPLGSNSLGIYDSEPQAITTATCAALLKQPVIVKPSLSETLLSLESYAARQTALNYVLNAMSILQARQCIVAALTSHSQMGNIGMGAPTAEKSNCDMTTMALQINDEGMELDNHTIAGGGSGLGSGTGGAGPASLNGIELIAQGGGEGPADVSAIDATPDSEAIPLHPLGAGPLGAFQSLAGSLSLSASISSCNATQKHSKMSASAMSVMAVTMTHQEEMIIETITGLDDFTSLLGETEAKSLVELLKLSVAGRTGPPTTVKIIANTLIALGSNSPSIGAMLLETCITELEDLCTSRHCIGRVPKPICQETSHPYIDDITLVGQVKIPGAEALRLEFDRQCTTEKRNDPLVIMDGTGRVIATRSGREYALWAPEIRIPGDEMRWKFTSDSSVNGWGWRFWVHAIMPSSFLHELGSDRSILSQPSMDLVMALLETARLGPQSSSIFLRLASALSACAQLSSLPIAQRIWSLKKLHNILTTSKYAPPPFDSTLSAILLPLIPALLRQYEYEEPQVRGGIHLMHSEYFKTLAALASDMQLDTLLPSNDMHRWAWFRRYCSAVRVAQSLIHRNTLPRPFCSEVRKKLNEMMPQTTGSSTSNLIANRSSGLGSSTLSAAMSSGSVSNLMSLPNMSTVITSSTQNIAMSSSSGPSSTHYMDLALGSSITDIDRTSSSSSSNATVADAVHSMLHEDHNLFKSQHDSQLLQWLNRRPEDWALSWGGASTIYGWGHNHRGQLGGLEGGRIKVPTPCEALSLLRPIQLAGGEQTLYSVTPDGKLFATGYGASGRLGINNGGDSVAAPTLIESLQHVFVKKVAVNSGGKHCLALTADGGVYSWGEGEDGKLGHGNHVSYDRPKLIEALTGIGVVDVACGSAHSACITTQGHVLTWGKGRYGRLGHGDSEDQLRPKFVEALLGYRAVDIACGSGDAQTLCITDDDNVWSWGDGDYGKLGRGGSDGCKIPMKIESLSGLGVVKVECGSQFSVALTRSGAVYTWGKGDYHRLGHGTVDHIRRPKKVAALQGKKIISIATGSLHCVACSDSGEVFTWGDNDEGQLGDGTVSAIQRPRLVTALQGKHIVKVTCGSAHTLALSTAQLSEGARLPPSPPLEYDLVRDLPSDALHARLVLLHHFSELLCPCLAMLPITGDLSLGALKDVLVYSIKEAAFRKVIQTTMVRDKHHGPVIELNRIQVKRSRSRSGGGLAGVDGMKSVFGQMVQKLPLLTQEALSLPHRVWKVKFVGESVDDCGGGYSESIAEMCDELQNGSVPLLIQTPNGRGEAGANRDCFLLDPTLTSVLQMNMFRFLGVLMGIAVRTGSPLSLNMAEPVWRQLAGETVRPNDLTEVDRDYVAGLLCIRDMDDDPKVFSTLELPFSTPSAKGHEIPLSTRYTRITPTNRYEYVRLALNYRIHEFDEQVKAVRDGMSKVIPVPLLSLFSAAELQAMVCGSPDIPLGLLKSVATYKGIESTSPLVSWFWDVMEEFSNQERSLFLRFVWGRTRLPRTIADFRGRDFVLQVLDKYSPPDHFLPESYTCFFLLKMPRYSCKSVLLEKLKYAIYFCKSIDTDEYARVAMGDPTEATGSEDNSDLESVTSHDVIY